MDRPFRVVTHKRWLAEQFAPLGAVQDMGFDINPKTACETVWWAPGAWVASALAAGVNLPLLSCGPYWLENIPMDYRWRGVKTMTVAESIRLAPLGGEREVFVKLPEAKLDSFPATTHLRNKHWATTIGQYHLPPETLIQIQDPVTFTVEGRFWIAHGRVVAKSLYRVFDKVWGEEGFAEPWGDYAGTARDLHALAQEVAAEVEGPPGYVLDVGITDKGQDLVVEANAAWSSGPYSGDPAGILEAIEAAHDFDCEYPQWRWQPNPVLYKARPLKVVADV